MRLPTCYALCAGLFLLADSVAAQQGVRLDVAFSPPLIVDACFTGPGSGSFDSQGVFADFINGHFAAVWSPATPVLAVEGYANTTQFEAVLNCTNQAATGVIQATLVGFEYVGTYTFYTSAGTQMGTVHVAAPLTIATPFEGSHPRSRFVYMTGTGLFGARVELEIDGGLAGRTFNIFSEGKWEVLVEPPAGTHSLRLRYEGSSSASDPRTVHMNYIPPPTLIADLRPFYELHKADIVVASASNSPQTVFYGPNWTHVALFMGGDVDGTPLIAEAVPSGESFGFSEVRELPLDISTAYQIFPNRVAVFRPRVALSNSQRDAIVHWARITTQRNLPYWSIPQLVTPVVWAYLAWSGTLHLPVQPALYLVALWAMAQSTLSTDRFICSTLVWRAYLEGTAGSMNLAVPNLLSAETGILAALDPVLIEQLGHVFVVPETFARSPQLRQIR